MANQCVDVMISEIVFYLLQKGAHLEPKRITTNDIAEGLGISQQTASRKVIQLEKEGAIERIDGKILLTGKMIADVRTFMHDVLDSLESESVVFKGKVVAGIGKGAYFLGQKEYSAQFLKKLDFMPFPGTLNVTISGEDIEKRLLLRQKKPIVVDGFERGGKRFGKIDVYKCAVAGIPCAIVFPEMSVHGLQVLEIIAPFSLRKKLKLEDGSEVQIDVVE